MKKFLALYLSEAAAAGGSIAEAFANTPPEQLQAGLAAWGEWYGKAGSAVLDMGAPLDNSTIITPTGVEKNPSAISGFTILEAESMEAAVALLQQHPHFHMPGSSVHIMEFVQMPGM